LPGPVDPTEPVRNDAPATLITLAFGYFQNSAGQYNSHAPVGIDPVAATGPQFCDLVASFVMCCGRQTIVAMRHKCRW